MSAGDIARPTYARSAIKPLQALPLVESGAADGFALSKAELSLACASHNSETFHVQAVNDVLSRSRTDHGGSQQLFGQALRVFGNGAASR